KQTKRVRQFSNSSYKKSRSIKVSPFQPLQMFLSSLSYQNRPAPSFLLFENIFCGGGRPYCRKKCGTILQESLLHIAERMEGTLYFVDRNKIEEILQFLEKQLALFEQTPVWESDLEKAALERICHTVIES